jgi:hypothetical protein
VCFTALFGVLTKWFKDWASLNKSTTNGQFWLQPKAGWPDWANFRPLCDCWLFAVSWRRSITHFYATFSHIWGWESNFDKKCVGLYFGRFFQKLIWSPWPKVIFFTCTPIRTRFTLLVAFSLAEACQIAVIYIHRGIHIYIHICIYKQLNFTYTWTLEVSFNLWWTNWKCLYGIPFTF